MDKQLGNNLGRMTGLRDPDLGNWSYSFDGVGNMVNQSDARGEVINFAYDGLNRLTRKDFESDADVVYTYDIGKVGTLFEANSSSGSSRFAYDNRLRLVSENYTGGSGSRSISYGFDALDRVVNTSFSSGEELTYTFNAGGMLDSIPGYVSGLDYTALGKVSNRTYDNGLVSELSYRSDSFRLEGIKTAGIQNLSYGYDDVGNVVVVDDSVKYGSLCNRPCLAE